jgi:hypothetical protein
MMGKRNYGCGLLIRLQAFYIPVESLSGVRGHCEAKPKQSQESTDKKPSSPWGFFKKTRIEKKCELHPPRRTGLMRHSPTSCDF